MGCLKSDRQPERAILSDEHADQYEIQANLLSYQLQPVAFARVLQLDSGTTVLIANPWVDLWIFSVVGFAFHQDLGCPFGLVSQYNACQAGKAEIEYVLRHATPRLKVHAEL